MEESWPCITCPSRDAGFCGALLAKESQQSPLPPNHDWQDHKIFRANKSIVNLHDVFEQIYVLCDGWAFRFLHRPDGRRQILRFLLPGDLFAPLAVFDEPPHFSVQALTDVRISRFNHTEVQARLSGAPALAKAAINACVGEIRDADELLAALGIGSAEERIAHLLCHLTNRLAARGVIRERRYRFPLRQKHIAEAVGLTTVHVSRVMRIFHERRLVELSGGILEVLNPTELERIGSFK